VLGSTHEKETNSILGSVCEAVVLVSITLIMIGLYLYASGSVTVIWLVLCGIVMGVGIAGSVAASYLQIREAREIAENTTYRITPQVVATLVANKVFSDVIFALENTLQGGDVTIVGKSQFLRWLEETFGTERSKEVNTMILRYARVRH
jgi:hypothetical protein